MSSHVLSGSFLRVTLANFFFFLNFAAFFLLPLYVKQLGGSEAVVGGVMGTSGVASLVVLPIVGLMIDRLGKRAFLMLGAGCMSAASAAYVFVESLTPVLFALRVVQGISFAMAFTAATALAAEFAPRGSRARALGIFGVSTLVTHAVAPALGEEVIRRGGFQALFPLAAVCSLVSVALALSLPGGTSRSGAHTSPPWRLDRIQWGLAATMVCCGVGFGTVTTFIPTFVHGEGLGRVGAFFGAYTAAAVLTRLVGAGLSDTLGRRAVILPTLLAFAASIFLLSLVRGVGALVLVGLLFGLAQGINYPTLHALLVDLTAEAHLGRAQALFNGAFSLGVTGSAFAFGLIGELWGHRAMFALASLVPLVGWLIFFVWIPTRAIEAGIERGAGSGP